MLKKTLTLFIPLFVSIALSTDVNIFLDGDNLNYTSSENIAGFQFTHNGCISGASGGDAAASGFIVSVSGTTVLGFSFTGAVIPSGEGTLLSLNGSVTEDCLTDFIFSGSGGVSLSSQYGDSDDPICDDVDLDGVCDDLDECVGDYDECGVCNGDGIADGVCDCDGNVLDCAGECGGSAIEDECGVWGVYAAIAR